MTVSAKPATIAISGVTITGTAKVGETLTANVKPSGATANYQWYADDVAINDATSSTYKPTADDVGKTITVTVTGTGNYTGTKTSAATDPVAAADEVTYTITVTAGTGGIAEASPASATAGTTVTLIATPNSNYAFSGWTVTSGDVKLSSLTVTDKDGNNVELTKVSDTKYTFTMPSGKVTVTPTFVETSDETPATLDTPTLINPLTDVSDGAYHYNAIQWAVANNITTGYADSTFRPYNNCTRAQIVTFMYRDFVG